MVLQIIIAKESASQLDKLIRGKDSITRHKASDELIDFLWNTFIVHNTQSSVKLDIIFL